VRGVKSALRVRGGAGLPDGREFNLKPHTRAGFWRMSAPATSTWLANARARRTMRWDGTGVGRLTPPLAASSKVRRC